MRRTKLFEHREFATPGELAKATGRSSKFWKSEILSGRLNAQKFGLNNRFHVSKAAWEEYLRLTSTRRNAEVSA